MWKMKMKIIIMVKLLIFNDNVKSIEKQAIM
jgi:hypothetical protein